MMGKTSREREEKCGIKIQKQLLLWVNKTLIKFNFYMVITRGNKSKNKIPSLCFGGQIKEIPTQTQVKPSLSHSAARTLISFTLYFASFVCHAKKTSSLLQTSVSEKMLCAATKYKNSKLEGDREAHVRNVFTFKARS